jgi:4-amino-4-deoxy-L-arabinose transferase-like glycosyltransferase
MRGQSDRARSFATTRRIDRRSLDETQPVRTEDRAEAQPDSLSDAGIGETRPNRYLNFSQPTSAEKPVNTRVLMPADLPEAPPPMFRPERSEDLSRGTTGVTAAIIRLFAQSEQHAKLLITAEHGLFALLVGLIFLVRVANLGFNTLHLDEAIYATVGQQALAGVFDQGATRWMFGSYLYPMIAGLTEQLGGATALRVLSALLLTAASIFVYLTAHRVFGKQAGLWALFIFGLSGIAINLGQHAVYDALGVPLLAASLYCITAAILEPRQEKFYFLVAGIVFSLSVLAKYVGVLMLPALIVTMLMLYLYQGRSLSGFFTQVAWSYFFIPVVVILGLYGLSHYADLREVLSGRFASQYLDRWTLFQLTVEEIGFVTLLALGGLLLLVNKAVNRMYPANQGRLSLFLMGLAPLLLGILAMPLYHLAAANFRALWKHNVYALVFLAPLAGYAIAKAVDYVRSLHGRYWLAWRAIGAIVTAVAMFWFINVARAQNNEFHQSWPPMQNVLRFMESQRLSEKSRVLASAYAVYEYYFDFGVKQHGVWDNVWYTEYDGLTGLDAVKKAIQDCVYDLAVLDEYYAPELNPVLEPLLKRAGYALRYEEPSRGPNVGIRGYVRPAQCAR